MNTINKKVEPNTDVRIEIDRPVETIGSTNITNWSDRLEEWINFLKDAMRILTQ